MVTEPTSVATSAPPAPAAAPGTGARADHSRFVQRVRRRYAAELPLLPPGVPDAAHIGALIDALLAGGRPLASAMRVARHLVLERLAVLDIEQNAALDDITRTMTALAEVTLDRALIQAFADQDARFGPPLDAEGRRIEFWVVGMGKLGAHELNVSSDIDLIYVYENAGQTTGPRSVSAHEYFSEVARSLYALIGEVTEDGNVFRVDLALRPNGNSGPPVVSLSMLEEYFVVQGREWERFAWLKSRVVAPFDSLRSGRAVALRDTVTAFVYRKYLDYGVFEGLRQLHRKVRDEAQRRAAGRPERANDVKLSRGGIREIEFIVQLLLVVRGGQFPEIRTRSTLRALQRLTSGGLMKPASAERLAKAYTFLRRVEHRIQFLDDQQTHLLPTADQDLAWIAASMGLAACDADTCELLDTLCETREFVATEFDALLHDGQAPSPAASESSEAAAEAAEPFGVGATADAVAGSVVAVDAVAAEDQRRHPVSGGCARASLPSRANADPAAVCRGPEAPEGDPAWAFHQLQTSAARQGIQAADGGRVAAAPSEGSGADELAVRPCRHKGMPTGRRQGASGRGRPRRVRAVGTPALTGLPRRDAARPLSDEWTRA